jgi:uncharacterized RDD family membrane protein YckC
MSAHAEATQKAAGSKYFTASTVRRLGAYVVDACIVGLLFLPVSLQAWQSYLARGFVEIEWKWIAVCFLLQFSYRWLFLKLLGATLGKMLFGLRLISINGNEQLTWMQSFLRVMVDHLSIFLGEAFKALMFLRFDRTHLSDWVAETKVVQFQRRKSYPARRVFFTIILFLYLLVTGFLKSYRMAQHSEFAKTTIKLSNF